MKIVFMHAGGVGDLLISLPAVCAVRDFYRPQETRLFCYPRMHGLMRAAGFEPCDVGGRETAALFDAQACAEDLRFIEGTDLMVSWFGFGDAAFGANAKKVCGRVFLFDPAAVPGVWMGEARETQIRKIDPALRVDRNFALDIGAVGEEAGPRVMLHPGAGGKQKRWPAEKFAELARRIVGAGFSVDVLLGPAEAGVEAAFEAVAEDFSGRVGFFRGRDLADAARRMKTCAAFAGNDSGPAHLAAVLGRPTVVLFGPTDSRVWRPAGRCVSVLETTPGLEAQAAAAAVFAAAKSGAVLSA